MYYGIKKTVRTNRVIIIHYFCISNAQLENLINTCYFMKIGIYGGSFNPVHIGHTRLAASILQQALVDELWLLVSPLNPLKQNAAADIAAYEHRLAMAELAVSDVEGLRVSDFERSLPVPSYMVNTLAALQTANPDDEFVLVIGADNWADFSKWYHHEEIVSRYSILVYRRPGCDIDESSLPPSVRVVDTPLYDISSTEIRQSIQNGAPLDEWIDSKVADYIRRNKLYLIS